jgi:hypothetical protein
MESAEQGKKQLQSRFRPRGNALKPCHMEIPMDLALGVLPVDRRQFFVSLERFRTILLPPLVMKLYGGRGTQGSQEPSFEAGQQPV